MNLTINISPVACSRPRVSKFGTYYAKPYQQYKTELTWLLKSLYRGNLLSGPIIIKRLVFFMPIPKSLSMKRKLALDGLYHTSKPDLDNLIKGFLDCANGILIEDDSMICAIENCQKIYSFAPRIEVELTVA